jgi:hypothetical protein
VRYGMRFVPSQWKSYSCQHVRRQSRPLGLIVAFCLSADAIAIKNTPSAMPKTIETLQAVTANAESDPSPASATRGVSLLLTGWLVDRGAGID